MRQRRDGGTQREWKQASFMQLVDRYPFNPALVWIGRHWSQGLVRRECAAKEVINDMHGRITVSELMVRPDVFAYPQQLADLDDPAGLLPDFASQGLRKSFPVLLAAAGEMCRRRCT